MTSSLRIDSYSPGDPGRYLGMDQLEDRLASLGAAPRDGGHVALLVRRRAAGLRDTPRRARLTREEGLPGDAWGRALKPHPEAQLTAVQLDVAEMIANGQPLTLFGDQLFLHLDLSQENLPTGSRLVVGEAVLEVTPQPHNGCQKFRSRFGTDALRFVSRADLRHRNFRGIYLRVITDGDVGLGDLVSVLRRGLNAAPE